MRFKWAFNQKNRHSWRRMLRDLQLEGWLGKCEDHRKANQATESDSLRSSGESFQFKVNSSCSFFYVLFLFDFQVWVFASEWGYTLRSVKDFRFPGVKGTSNYKPPYIVAGNQIQVFKSYSLHCELLSHLPTPSLELLVTFIKPAKYLQNT